MRKPLTISITEEDYTVLKSFCDKTGLTMSKLYEEHTKGLVKAAKLSGILKKENASKLDLIRFFAKGMTLDV